MQNTALVKDSDIRLCMEAASSGQRKTQVPAIADKAGFVLSYSRLNIAEPAQRPHDKCKSRRPVFSNPHQHIRPRQSSECGIINTANRRSA